MNIRKAIDYSDMYSKLDELMEKSLPQMELYREIGRLVCSRPEKGAAVMMSEYLRKNYSDVAGFSPRNVRRMREFFRTYGSNEALMAEAMKIGWTQNVLIMERCTDDAERQWYLRAVFLFGWSKLELTAKLDDGTHLKMTFAPQEEVCYTEDREGNGDGKEKTRRPLLQNLRDAQIQRELQRERSCCHIYKACAKLKPEQQAEQMTLNPLIDLPLRRLTDSELRQLKNHTHDRRPEVREMARSVYAERFPHAVRNAKKQELTIKFLDLVINGEILDENWEPVLVQESYHISRLPPEIIRTDSNGTSTKIELPPRS